MKTSSFVTDLAASVVVFLVAVPLCLGIAVASGVPAALGLISGIVGGLVVGSLAGSPLQVSGPAAGLAVIVFGFVEQYGFAALGPVVLAAGLLQIVASVMKIGSWFRAISPAVVHGMLAGIGILIVLGQIHVLMDAKPAAGGIENVAAIDESLGALWHGGMTPKTLALLVGLASLLAMLGWEKVRPLSLKLVPGALMGVVVGTVLAVAFDLPIARVDLPASLIDGISVPGRADFVRLLEPGILMTTLVIAVVASAETLLSAAAVDRMHDGARTRFNKELFAQGIGNGLCGMLGALPITGVIVRSSANIQAGARSRMSAVLHGAWILALVALLPQLLGIVPLTALAAVLLVTGLRLISLHHVRHLFTHHGWVPVGIWFATVLMIVTHDVLVGVGVGFALSILEVVPYLRRRLHIEKNEQEGRIALSLEGAATCKDIPRLLDTLDGLPPRQRLTLAAPTLAYLDHSCAETISDWLKRERRAGRPVDVVQAARNPRVGPQLRRFHGEVTA